MQNRHERSRFKGEILGSKWRAGSRIEERQESMGNNDHSCSRHSEASRDLTKTAQLLRTLSQNSFARATKTHLQDCLRNTTLSLISATIIITPNCN